MLVGECERLDASGKLWALKEGQTGPQRPFRASNVYVASVLLSVYGSGQHSASGCADGLATASKTPTGKIMVVIIEELLLFVICFSALRRTVTNCTVRMR